MSLQSQIAINQSVLLIKLIKLYDERYIELEIGHSTDKKLKLYESEINRLANHGMTENICDVAFQYLESRQLSTKKSQEK